MAKMWIEYCLSGDEIEMLVFWNIWSFRTIQRFSLPTMSLTCGLSGRVHPPATSMNEKGITLDVCTHLCPQRELKRSFSPKCTW